MCYALAKSDSYRTKLLVNTAITYSSGTITMSGDGTCSTH